MHNNNEFKQDEDFIEFIDERIVARLSEALIFNLRIPEGIELVSNVGNGNENSNREAIKTWVSKQQINHDDFEVSETLAYLEEKLVYEVNELKTRSVN